MQEQGLNMFPVIYDGSKRTTVKANKEKYEISYLSKKEFSQRTEEADKSNKDIELIGFTTLKESSLPKSETAKHADIVGLLSVDHTFLSSIKRKKKTFHSVKGYLFVGSNRYVAIQKFNFMVFPVILLIGLICAGFILGFSGNYTDPVNPWFPVLEEITEADDETSNEIPQIQVAGFYLWHIPKGETENIPVMLKNPEGNPCYFSFSIRLKDTGEILYTSKMVQPGDTIKRINISKPLDAGKYIAVIHISTNELITGNEMNDTSFEAVLTVS